MIAEAHPSSWYAATARGLVEYPSLTATLSADVCVVGAGYTGLSAALHLADVLRPEDLVRLAVEALGPLRPFDAERLQALLGGVGGHLAGPFGGGMTTKGGHRSAAKIGAP